MLLHLTQFGTVVGAVAPAAVYCPPRPNQRALKIEHNWIWMKMEKVDNRFTMLKDYILPRYMFDKSYQT